MNSEKLNDDVLGMIARAWQLMIGDYNRGMLCSEATMVASFYSHLRTSAKYREAYKQDLRVLVAPTTAIPMNNIVELDRQCFPDLLLVHHNPKDENLGRVLLCSEFKYAPFHTTQALRDLQKFTRLMRKQHQSFTTNPATGRDFAKGYEYTDETLYYLMHIANAEKQPWALHPQWSSQLSGQMAELLYANKHNRGFIRSCLQRTTILYHAVGSTEETQVRSLLEYLIVNEKNLTMHLYLQEQDNAVA